MESKSKTTKQHRLLRGTVERDAKNKTVVVRVTRVLWHPKYQRQYHASRRYQVHDEHNACHAGDVVEFVETRPLSRHKRWRLMQKVNR